jgi:two-component system nitrate/nitrite response regulator NarL
MSTKYSTLVIDPSRLFREGLKRLLAEASYEIIAEATNIDEALNLIRDGLEIDLLVGDFDGEELPDANCIRMLREVLSESKIVVLTSRLASSRLAESLNAGADGYLLKEISAQALERSLELVMVGETVFPTCLAKLLVNGQFSSYQRQMAIPASSTSADLSERETQILGCLVNGDPNKVIARCLHISEATVKVHLKSLLKKIRAANRTQAAVWALNNRLPVEHNGESPYAGKRRTESVPTPAMRRMA